MYKFGGAAPLKGRNMVSRKSQFWWVWLHH